MLASCSGATNGRDMRLTVTPLPRLPINPNAVKALDRHLAAAAASC